MRLFLAVTCLAAAAAFAEKPTMSFYDLKTKTLDGKPADMSAYKGKVLLVVNTASQCGSTPQYAGLEKIHEEMKDKGVEVLGFPSNDFGGQEPGTAAEIKKFCELNYKVDFPLFEKVKTHGDGVSPVFAFLNQKHGAPEWNFYKYVVGKDGQVRAKFSNKVKPEAEELRKAIDAALKE